MWWIVSFIVIILFSKLDDIIELFKSKNPHYQKEKEAQRLAHDQEQSEIIEELKSVINLDCQIVTEDLYFMSNHSGKINAKVVNVDDDWVELLVDKKRKQIKLFLKVKNISSISKIL